MNAPTSTTLQGRVTAARRQLAWVPLTTLVELVKDAKAGLDDEAAFMAELSRAWKQLKPSTSMTQIAANVSAVMTLARHGD